MQKVDIKDKRLSNYYSINRRYSRSINLERDFDNPNAVEGYVVNAKAIEVLKKFSASLLEGGYRAWTITGVYGTGKSAFAHFWSSLCASKVAEIKKVALRMLADEIGKNNDLYKKYDRTFPAKGFMRAVVTAQSEPVSNTIIRALYRGGASFWGTKKPNIYKDILRENRKISQRHDYIVSSKQAFRLLFELSKVTKTGILLIIDELGKNLEYALHSKTFEDLYLLQQIAEMSTQEGSPHVYLVGILHQAFSDYLNSASQEKKNEWAKIQGRFEDIVFSDTLEQEVKIVSKVFQKESLPCEYKKKIGAYGYTWKEALRNNKTFSKISKDLLSSVYPLHPLATIILPFLCHKYAQSDRTLFTFLTSNEPFSFNSFLKTTSISEGISTVKLHNVYDYFVESALGTISLRPDFQRWSEIRERVSDARNLDEASLKVLKTIGVFNLIFTSGDLRASKELVIMALCDSLKENEQKYFWRKVIEQLIKKNIILWRKQADELRLWEGSDFDIELFLEEEKIKVKESLADLLNENYALKDLVAQRHSYEKGALRHFRQVFFDDIDQLNKFAATNIEIDGLIIYWLGDIHQREFLPLKTAQGKPIISVMINTVNTLNAMCCEYVALKNLRKGVSQLSHDGIARKEVNQRIHIAKTFLDREIDALIDFSHAGSVGHIVGISSREDVASRRSFNNVLSQVCDRYYKKSLILRNELINKSRVTTQVSKARKILAEALLNNRNLENFGIEGYGPEKTILESLFIKTKILQFNEIKGQWIWHKPTKASGLFDVWNTIEFFLDKAVQKPYRLIELYKILENPPFGVKAGVIPLLLLAVLLSKENQVGIFKNGTFLHKLTVDDIELFEKKPLSYSFKSFNLRGVRIEAYAELEKIFYTSKNKMSKRTLVGLAKPFISFVRSLPKFTIETKDLKPRTLAVRMTLLEARDPDDLLFVDLPNACGLKSIHDNVDIRNFKKLRKHLEATLSELYKKYDLMLHDSAVKIKSAFGVPETGDLYTNLKERAIALRGVSIEKKLKAFIFTASDETIDEATWLKGLLMIAVDRPSELWSDEDVHRLDFNLNDLGRRFGQFEKMRDKIAASSDPNLTAINVMLTSSDSKEINEIYWADRKLKNKVELFALDLFTSEEFKSKEFRSAFLALLIERMSDSGKKKVHNEKG